MVDSTRKIRALADEITALQATYDQLRTAFEPALKELSLQADRLAAQFKLRFEEASIEYSAGSRARAKELSVEGHALKDRCQQINQEANALRWQLKAMLDRLLDLRREREALVSVSRAQDRIAARIPFVRFAEARSVDEVQLRRVLASLPTVLAQRIARVTFVDEQLTASIDGYRVSVRATTHGEDTGATVIRLGRQPSWENPATRQRTITQALLHEIGHIAYAQFLDDDERACWSAWYQEDDAEPLSEAALAGDVEDFCEYFALYCEDPIRVEQIHSDRFSMLATVFGRMEDAAR